MGVSNRYVDFRKGMEKLNGNFVYLNDLDPQTDMELIKRLTLSVHDSPTFSLIPACNCGETTLENHPELNIGDYCEYCHTEIAVHSSRKLIPSVWIRSPDEIPALINPAFLSTFIDAYRMSGLGKRPSLVEWLLDPYDKRFTDDRQIDFLVQNHVQRGLSYFVKDHERIMNLLMDDRIFTHNRTKKEQVFALYQRFKDYLFVPAIPLVDKSFNNVESNSIATYIDLKTFNSHTNVINSIIGLKRLKKKPSLNKVNSVYSSALFGLVNYYAEFAAANNDKKGIWRKHIFGSRMPWTSRMVITSLHEPHDYDECHYPWSAFIPLYELHITNYLLKRGMKPNEIKQKIHHSIHNYDEEIAEIIDDMIHSSPYKTVLSGKPGLPIINNRNPSLKIGNIQQMFITKVKPDPTDITLSFSILTLGGFGGDYDGDELNQMAIIDVFQMCSLVHLEPATNVFSKAEPNKLSGDFKLPKQTWVNIGNWIEEGVELPWQP